MEGHKCSLTTPRVRSGEGPCTLAPLRYQPHRDWQFRLHLEDGEGKLGEPGLSWSTEHGMMTTYGTGTRAAAYSLQLTRISINGPDYIPVVDPSIPTFHR